MYMLVALLAVALQGPVPNLEFIKDCPPVNLERKETSYGWTSSVDLLAHGFAEAWNVKGAPDGDFYDVGYGSISRLDSKGHLVWTRSLPGGASDEVPTSDGVIVSLALYPKSETLITKFSRDGRILWKYRKPKSVPMRMIGNDQGSLFVEAISVPDSMKQQPILLKIDEETGVLNWEFALSLPGGSYPAFEFCPAKDGGMAALSASDIPHDHRAAVDYRTYTTRVTIKRISPTGRLQFEKAYDHGGTCVFSDALIDDDGEVFVLINRSLDRFETVKSNSGILLKFSSDGELVSRTDLPLWAAKSLARTKLQDVIVSETGGLVCVANDNKIKWSTPLPSALPGLEVDNEGNSYIFRQEPDIHRFPHGVDRAPRENTLAKVDAEGKIAWILPNILPIKMGLWGLGLTANQEPFIIGENNRQTLELIEVSKLGSIAWKTTNEIHRTFENVPEYLVDKEGNSFLRGQSLIASTASCRFIKLDPNGKLGWVRQVNMSGDATMLMEPSGDGGLYCAWGPTAWKYSQDGTVVWTCSLHTKSITCVNVAPNGDLLVGGNYPVFAARLSPAGLVRMTSEGRMGEVKDLASDKNGNTFITGLLGGAQVLQKINGLGSVLWRIDGTGKQPIGGRILVSNLGDAVIRYDQRTPFFEPGAILAVDLNGKTLWSEPTIATGPGLASIDAGSNVWEVSGERNWTTNESTLRVNKYSRKHGSVLVGELGIAEGGQIVLDGAGGAFISRQLFTDQTSTDYGAVHLNAKGTISWPDGPQEFSDGQVNLDFNKMPDAQLGMGRDNRGNLYIGGLSFDATGQQQIRVTRVSQRKA